jgi:hemolysin III
VRDLHRALLSACYLGMGWISLLLLPKLYSNVPPTVFGLLIAGGVLYTLGAVVYVAQRPDPLPRIFGFHEVFHAFVIAAAICHYAAVYPLITA